VVIRPRAGRPYYALRYTEPESGIERTPRLHDVTTPKAAAKAAVQLWRNLERRKLQVTVAGGRAHACSVATLRQEIETYLTAVKRKVSKRGKRTSAVTVRRYRDSLEQWASWCEKRDCMHLNQLVRTGLSEWVAARLGTLSLTARGEPRKVSTINQEVKPVRQMLVAAALAGRLVHLSSDAIRGALKRLTQEAPTPRCYSVPEIRDALRAAMDFDVSPLKSRRSAPTAPLVAAGLLGGLRRGELASLQVHDVLFDAPSDYDPSITTGVDVLRLPKHKVKTGVARDVQMVPYSPLLGELMRELIRGRAGHERVFRMSYQSMGSLSKRLRAAGRTPPKGFCMKDLRSTCATYQSPLVGNAKAKADRLGHTLAVAEEHYLALPSGTPLTAPDLETVMQCAPELREIIARLKTTRQPGKR
jgi:integrase